MPDPRPPLGPEPDDAVPGSLIGLVCDDALIADLDARGDDLGGAFADLVELVGCRFTDVRLADGDWRKPDWANTVLDTCDLANLTLTEASWRRVRLSGCRVTGLQLAAGNLRDVTMDGCSGELVNLRQSKLQRVVFERCQLPGVDLGEAELVDVEFRGCDLTGVRFNGVRTTRLRFDDCILDGISGITELAGATISGGDPYVLAHTMAEALRIRLA